MENPPQLAFFFFPTSRSCAIERLSSARERGRPLLRCPSNTVSTRRREYIRFQEFRRQSSIHPCRLTTHSRRPRHAADHTRSPTPRRL